MLSSLNLPYDHLPKYTDIIFRYLKNNLGLSHNSSCDVPISPYPVPKSHIIMSLIHLVMTQISTSPVPKKHIVMSHNLSQRDPKLTSPVPKNHLIRSQNSSRYDHKSSSPVPKSDLVLSHISSRYDVISTSPVPKTTLFCPIIHLVETHYQLILSQKDTLFVP